MRRFLVLLIVVIFIPICFSFAHGPDTLWTKKYVGNKSDIGFSVKQTSDGGYIIAGMTESFGFNNSNGYLIKTDSNGDTSWTEIYGDSTELVCSVISIFQTDPEIHDPRNTA
jgi:hypothetical protein